MDNKRINDLLENISSELNVVREQLSQQQLPSSANSNTLSTSTSTLSRPAAAIQSRPATAIRSRPPSATISSAASSTEQQMRYLFPQMTGKKKKTDFPSPFVKETFTRDFSCLPFHYSAATPSSQMSVTLEYAGLGRKKITFEGNDSHQNVVEKIYLAYPRLRKCGFFTIHRANGGGNNRPVVKINVQQYDVPSLRRFLKGRAVVYLRPLQDSLSLQSLKSDELGDPSHVRSKSTKIKCIKCDVLVDFSRFENHRMECPRNKRKSDAVDSDSEKGNALEISSDEEKSEAEKSDCQEEGTDLIQNFIKLNKEIVNPVILLQTMQTVFQTGRQLDISDESSCPVGETTLLLVDRDNLLETGFTGLSGISEEDKYVTLEIQFSHELAKDYGGPRKEFFRLMLLEVKEVYFDNGFLQDKSKDYYTIGFLMGLSMLQNGKIPQFLDPDTVEKLFDAEEPSICILELRKGLDRLGFYEVGRKIPVLKHLFQPNIKSLTLRSLKHTMIRNVKFGEAGTNASKAEKEVFQKFQEYLNEVAAGRREFVTLEKILLFVTGADEVPLLGYKLDPSIHFMETSKTRLIPTANTCVNRLNLNHPPCGEALPNNIFDLFDHAFTSTWFGLV